MCNDIRVAIPPYEPQLSASGYQQAAASQPEQLQQQILGYQTGTCGHQIKSSGISAQQPGMSYQPSFGEGHQQSMAAEIQPFSTGSQQNQQTTGDLDLITQLYVATVSSNFTCNLIKLLPGVTLPPCRGLWGTLHIWGRY